MSRHQSTERQPSPLRLRSSERPTTVPRAEPPRAGWRQQRAPSLTEATTRYEAARDAWIAAMRAAVSGRPADLASLALVQEEYELATAERDRWQSGERVAIPIETVSARPIDAIVGQQLAWREIREQEEQRHRRPPGLLGRLFGRGRARGR